jgi:hypothetical protein
MALVITPDADQRLHARSSRAEIGASASPQTLTELTMPPVLAHAEIIPISAFYLQVRHADGCTNNDTSTVQGIISTFHYAVFVVTCKQCGVCDVMGFPKTVDDSIDVPKDAIIITSQSKN